MYSYLFTPRGPRAQGHRQLRSSLGALLGIAISALAGMAVATRLGDALWLVAPMGASAVLVFAVPASPLAQPYAVAGGNLLSALVGLAVARLMPEPLPCAAMAVALAILAMHLLRCLHPPGGAMALLAAMTRHEGMALPWHFVLAPVAVNSLALVAVGWAFNNLTGSRYPHQAEVLPEHRRPMALDYDRSDLVAVLDELEDAPDVTVDDLDAIFRAVQIRRRAELCSEMRSIPRAIRLETV